LDSNTAYKDRDFQYNLLVSFNRIAELGMNSDNKIVAAELIQKILIDSEFSTTHPLAALRETDKLIPFKTEDDKLSEAGMQWQRLIQHKLDDIVPSLHNEKNLALELDKLNLGQINALRLTPLLEKAETADDFYHIIMQLQ